MVFSFVAWREMARVVRRHGPVAAGVAIVAIVLIGLAAAGAIRQSASDKRLANERTASAIDKAKTLLDRERRDLDALGRLAATRPDAAVQQFLDQLPLLSSGTRAAAIVDASGAVQLRSADTLDPAVLARLAADARTAQPGAISTTQALSDGGTMLVGLASTVPGSDIVALVVIDAKAFPGLDLVRADGSSLFGGTAAGPTYAVGDFHLRLASPAKTATRIVRALPFVAAAILGLAALSIVLGLLLSRLRAATDQIAQQAAVERTLRRELASAAAAVDRTDEINRTKSRFFAQVTHELRTPLNAILGFSETIRQQMFGPIANGRYLEYARLIHEAGAHLLSLINDLLDSARVEAGKMEISPIRMSAAALGRSALDLVELLAAERGIALTHAGLGSCPDLNVDPRAMKQVLVNLLSNAIKYTLPGGRIELRFAARDDGGAAITIADTGIGMSMQDLRAAFEPFGRAGGVEVRRQQGTGLGLSLARALVRLHGGELTLVSQLDFGTTATVVLPACAVCAPPAKAALSDATAKAA
ncbi:MAG TPA: HAMP domain-containing sensor histidine kinase [Stellaceae bacterium]|nr:HAMP domain-containing sensor histidine kinase [Stellaceae bacterium]